MLAEARRFGRYSAELVLKSDQKPTVKMKPAPVLTCVWLFFFIVVTPVSYLWADNAECSTKFRLLVMDQRYLGEEKKFFGLWGVRYLKNDAQRSRYEVKVKDGLLVDSKGRPFTSTRSWFGMDQIASWLDGRGSPPMSIFVISRDGKMYIGPGREGVFHHSTFFAGQPVLSAGMVSVKDGKVIQVSDQSGHYKPSAYANALFCKWMHENGQDISEVDYTVKNWREIIAAVEALERGTSEETIESFTKLQRVEALNRKHEPSMQMILDSVRRSIEQEFHTTLSGPAAEVLPKLKNLDSNLRAMEKEWRRSTDVLRRALILQLTEPPLENTGKIKPRNLALTLKEAQYQEFLLDGVLDGLCNIHTNQVADALGSPDKLREADPELYRRLRDRWISFSYLQQQLLYGGNRDGSAKVEKVNETWFR